MYMKEIEIAHLYPIPIRYRLTKGLKNKYFEAVKEAYPQAKYVKFFNKNWIEVWLAN